MDTTSIVVREACPDDLPTILNLIHLKAAFDGCPDAVTATQATLATDLFSPAPLAFVLLAECNSSVVGFATYHFIYSTFLARRGIWLDDLYVRDGDRGRGVGQALMNHLGKVARKYDCGRIDWTVAVTNEKGISFYQKIGAVVMQKVRLCRFLV